MISKELFFKIEKCNKVYKDIELWEDKENNSITVSYDGEAMYDINIHELTHKLKEWASDKGYFIRAWLSLKTIVHNPYNKTIARYWTCEILRQLTNDSHCMGILKNFEYEKDKSKTEHEIVIKACEWILKETQK